MGSRVLNDRLNGNGISSRKRINEKVERDRVKDIKLLSIDKDVLRYVNGLNSEDLLEFEFSDGSYFESIFIRRFNRRFNVFEWVEGQAHMTLSELDVKKLLEELSTSYSTYRVILYTDNDAEKEISKIRKHFKRF